MDGLSRTFVFLFLYCYSDANDNVIVYFMLTRETVLAGTSYTRQVLKKSYEQIKELLLFIIPSLLLRLLQKVVKIVFVAFIFCVCENTGANCSKTCLKKYFEKRQFVFLEF